MLRGHIPVAILDTLRDILCGAGDLPEGVARVLHEQLGTLAAYDLHGGADLASLHDDSSSNGYAVFFAGLILLQWCRSNAEHAAARRLLHSLSDQPQPDGLGLDILHIGDHQARILAFAKTDCRSLLWAALDAMPEFRGEQPVLSATIDELLRAHGPVLSDANVLVGMPVLAEAPRYFEELQRLGMSKDRTRVLAIPYSSNALAVERLNQLGWTTENPYGLVGTDEQRWGATIDVHSMKPERQPFEAIQRSAVANTVRRALEQWGDNGKPFVVIDDGGYFAKVINEDFPEQAHRFRFVEQTTRGIKKIKSLSDDGKLATFAVNVAQAPYKATIENDFIGDAVVDALLAELRGRVGTTTHDGKLDLSGCNVGVIGYGAIGQAVCAVMKSLGAAVTTYDIDAEKLRAAAASGVRAVSEPEQVLAGQQIVVGATGLTSVDAVSFLQLPPNAHLISVSSNDTEFLDSWCNALAIQSVRDTVSGAVKKSFGAVPRSGQFKVGNVDVSLPFDQPEDLSDLLAAAQARVMAANCSAKLPPWVRVKVGFEKGPDLAATLRAQLPAELQPVVQQAQRETFEAIMEAKTQRDPIWLVNGGYPVNHQRRLRAMPLLRIQGTLAALASGAVQTMLSDRSAKGIVPLRADMDERVTRNMAKLAPAAYHRGAS